MKYTAVVTYHEVNDFGVQLQRPYWQAQIPFVAGEANGPYASVSGSGETPEDAVASLQIQMRLIDMMNAPKRQKIVEFQYGPPENPARED